MRPIARFVIVACACCFSIACTPGAPVGETPPPNAAAPQATAADSKPKSATIQCAVIGGLADTGLWHTLSDRFEKETGHHMEVAVRGPKHEITGEFIDGNAHLIAMHSSDTMINLVADGYATSAQPWARNDFVLVGPESDPAGIRGMQDATAALAKVIESKSKILVHASHGAMEVLGDLMAAGELSFDPEHTLIRLEDRHRQMLLYAGEQKAYTLIGRIPFLNGKVPKQDLAIMVQSDPRMRRPYLVAVSGNSKLPKLERVAAQRFASFLRSEPIQKVISEYGRGTLDAQPLFFRVQLPAEE